MMSEKKFFWSVTAVAFGLWALAAAYSRYADEWPIWTGSFRSITAQQFEVLVQDQAIERLKYHSARLGVCGCLKQNSLQESEARHFCYRGPISWSLAQRLRLPGNSPLSFLGPSVGDEELIKSPDKSHMSCAESNRSHWDAVVLGLSLARLELTHRPCSTGAEAAGHTGSSSWLNLSLSARTVSLLWFGRTQYRAEVLSSWLPSQVLRYGQQVQSSNLSMQVWGYLQGNQFLFNSTSLEQDVGLRVRSARLLLGGEVVLTWPNLIYLLLENSAALSSLGEKSFTLIAPDGALAAKVSHLQYENGLPKEAEIHLTKASSEIPLRLRWVWLAPNTSSPSALWLQWKLVSLKLLRVAG